MVSAGRQLYHRIIHEPRFAYFPFARKEQTFDLSEAVTEQMHLSEILI